MQLHRKWFWLAACIDLLASCSALAAVNEGYVPRDGLLMWLAADAINQTSNSSVGVWVDRSGQGNNAVQPDVSLRPSLVGHTQSVLNGKPTVKFTASAKTHLIAPASLNPATLTVFVVGKSPSVTGPQILCEKINGSAGYAVQLAASNSVTARINQTSTSASYVSDTYQLITHQYDGGTSRLGINGAFSSSVAVDNLLQATEASLTIGGRLSAYNFNGEIAEVILYGRSVSDAERRDVEAYIYWKYGVSAQPTIAAPVADKTSGIYDKSFTVSLSASPGAVIRYTLDGTAPGAESPVYTGPLPILSQSDSVRSVKLRAVVKKEGYIDGPELSETYVLDERTTFLPRSGLKVWLRSDTLSSGPVSEWRDQSGCGNHASQSVANARPICEQGAVAGIDGRSMVTFAAANKQFLTIPTSTGFNPSRLTLIGVVRRTSSASAPMVFLEKGVGNVGKYALRSELSGQVDSYINADRATTSCSSGVSSGDFHVVASQYDLVQHRLYVDDLANPRVMRAYASTLSTSTDAITIGGRSTALNLDGNVMEIALYDRALSTEEMKDWQAYVKARYAIDALPQPQLAPPNSSIQSGVYATDQTVVLKAAPGAKIWYTADQTQTVAIGNAKTVQYSKPLQVKKANVDLTDSTQIQSPASIRAIAVKPGYIQSEIATVDISVDPARLLPREGLALWLSASDLVVGSRVSVWPDKSGAQNDAQQAVVACQPLVTAESTPGVGSIKAVSFSATRKDRLSLRTENRLNPSDQFSVFVVGKRNAGSSIAMLLDRGSNVSDGLKLKSTTLQGSVNDNVVSLDKINAQPLALKTFYRFGHIYDGKKNRILVNETSTDVPYNRPITAPTSAFTIGGRNDTYNLDGSIAEVLYYNRALSEDEMAEVTAYLYSKYSIGTQPKLKTPIANVGSGVYAGPQKIKLIADQGATIQYKIADGAFKAYSGEEIEISSTTALQAYATRPGFQNSDTFTKTYTIEAGSDMISRADLALWLRADVGLFTNAQGAVESWADQSGSENNALLSSGMPGPTISTINSKPALLFSGNTNFVVSDKGALDGDKMSIVAVVQSAGNATRTGMMVLDKGNEKKGYSLQVLSITNAKAVINSTARTVAELERGTPALLEAVHDQVKFRLVVNGDKIQEATFSDPELPLKDSPLCIGGRVGKSDYNFDGKIAEIFVYRRALSDYDCNSLRAYLLKKYGIDGHPQLEPPISSVQSGIYSVAQSVVLSARKGMRIYYTIDGSPPTLDSAVYTSHLSVEPGQSHYLRFIASDPDGLFKPSEAAEALVVVDASASVPTDGLKVWLSAQGLRGLDGQGIETWPDFSGNRHDAKLPDLNRTKPQVVGNYINGAPMVKFPANSNSVLTIPNSEDLNPTTFAIYSVSVGSGNLVSKYRIDERSDTNHVHSGYKFYIDPDENEAEAWVGCQDAYRRYPMSADYDISRRVPQALSVKFHTTYDAKSRATSYLRVSKIGAGSDLEQTPGVLMHNARSAQIGGAMGADLYIAELLMYNRVLSPFEERQVTDYFYNKYKLGMAAQLEAPRFNVGSGRYASAQDVRIDGVSGATVYYTLDGSDPSTASPVYSAPLHIASNATIKAIAVQPGFVDSTISVLKLQFGPSERERDEDVPPGFSTDSDQNGVPDAVEHMFTDGTNRPFDGPSGIIFEYDAIHQLRVGPGRSYQYDGESNLVGQ